MRSLANIRTVLCSLKNQNIAHWPQRTDWNEWKQNCPHQRKPQAAYRHVVIGSLQTPPSNWRIAFGIGFPIIVGNNLRRLRNLPMFCGEVFTIGNTCLTTKKIINAICALRIFKKGAHAYHTNIEWNLLFVKCCDACWRPKLQISHTTIWLTPVGYTYRFTFARVDPPERWPGKRSQAVWGEQKAC